jgi:hypothetical protein
MLDGRAPARPFASLGCAGFAKSGSPKFNLRAPASQLATRKLDRLCDENRYIEHLVCLLNCCPHLSCVKAVDGAIEPDDNRCDMISIRARGDGGAALAISKRSK